LLWYLNWAVLLLELKMDTMLPSPGFSIPSVGTPLHQPEEDQQIIFQPQQQQHYSTNLLMSNTPHNQMPTSLQLPHKQHTYAPSAIGVYSTPQNLLQPQTPVSFLENMAKDRFIVEVIKPVLSWI